MLHPRTQAPKMAAAPNQCLELQEAHGVCGTLSAARFGLVFDWVHISIMSCDEPHCNPLWLIYGPSRKLIVATRVLRAQICRDSCKIVLG